MSDPWSIAREGDMDAMFLVMTIGGIAITIVVLAGAAFVVWRVIGGLTKTAKEEARILQTGTPARAQILQVQMGGMTVTTGVHRRLEVVITMQVQPPNGAPYTTQIKTLVSELNIPQVQPGAWVQVRIDPTNPHRVVIEGFGVAAAQAGPMGGFGQPAAAPAGGGYGQPQMAQPGFVPAAPAGGFKLPLGAKIGLAIGGIGALLGVTAAIVAVVWTMGIGGPSAVCKQARDCCRQMSGNSIACDNYTKQTGPIADKVCEETLASYKKTGVCK
jgi:hypothetical protein